MISHKTERFTKSYDRLPSTVKAQADRAFKTFFKEPFHPSLHFKRVHSSKPVYSIRISRDYRALGVQQKYEVIWFWIGSHTDYDKLLKRI